MLELYSHPPRLSRAAFFLLVIFGVIVGFPGSFTTGTLRSLFDLSFGLNVCDSSFLVEICPPAHHSLSTIILPDCRYNLRHIRSAWARPYLYRTSHHRLSDTHLGPVHTNVFSKVWVFVVTEDASIDFCIYTLLFWYVFDCLHLNVRQG